MSPLEVLELLLFVKTLDDTVFILDLSSLAVNLEVGAELVHRVVLILQTDIIISIWRLGTLVAAFIGPGLTDVGVE